jgi:hypothetical protein
MFLVAAIVRLTTFGLDALTMVFGAATVIAGGAAVFTGEQLRRIRP